MKNCSYYLILFTSIVLCLLLTTSNALAVAGVTDWQYRDPIAASNQEATAMAVDSAGSMIITGHNLATGNKDYRTVKVASDGVTVVWAKPYNDGTANGEDWPVAVAVDSADDVFVTGKSFNGSDYDIITIKYDGSNGDVIWTHTFKGDPEASDYPYTNDYAIAMDVYGDAVYVVGYSDHGGTTHNDAVLFKLPSGDSLSGDGLYTWLATYDDATLHENERFNDVDAGPSGIAVTGFTDLTDHGAGVTDDRDFLVMKYDAADGSQIWKGTYDGGTGEDVANKVQMDDSGYVIITGKSLVGAKYTIQTIKYYADARDLDTNGSQDEFWTANYAVGQQNEPNDLAVDSSGNAYVTGYTSPSGLEDFYTACYAAADGSVTWEDPYNSAPNNKDVATAITVNNLGSVFVTGYVTKSGADDDFLTIKYNAANGNKLWNDPHNASFGDNNRAVELAIGPNGDLYVGGWADADATAGTDLDFYAVKYDAGNLNSPTDLIATLISGEVKLDWSDNSDVPNNEEKFCIDRCQNFSCTVFAELACTAGADTITLTDGTVAPDKWYSYKVRAYSTADGYSLPSNTISILTTAIDYPSATGIFSYDGTATDGDDMAYAIAIGADNTPVATGTSKGLGTQYDYYTAKINKDSMAAIWTQRYNDIDGQADTATAITTDGDDHVIVTGISSLDNGSSQNYSDIFTIKYDADNGVAGDGYPYWQIKYDGPGNVNDGSTSVAAVTDSANYVYLTGYGHNAGGNDDIYIVKYNPDYDSEIPQLTWDTVYPTVDSGYDEQSTGIALDPAGDVIVVGKALNAGTDTDILISKYYGSDGSLVAGWPYQKDSGYGNDGVNAVTVDDDGFIYVAGYVKNASGNLDWYINKFNGAGVPQWGADGITLNGDFNAYDEALAIAVDPNDGEIVVGGNITSASGSQDMHLRRYQADGTLRWTQTLDRASNDDAFVAMALSVSGEICLVGDTDNGTDFDIIVVKYNHLGSLIASTLFDNGDDDYSTGIASNKLGEFFISGYYSTGPLVGDDDDFVVFKFVGAELQAPSPFTTVIHHTTVDLTWTENDPSIDNYFIYRKDGACEVGGTNFPAAPIHTASQGTVTYNASGLTIGSVYCFGVQSYVDATSDYSRIIEQEVTTTTPVAPDTFSTEVINSTDIKICWQDNTATEDGFAIQRCTGSPCNFDSHDTLYAPAEADDDAPQTCYTDTTACDDGGGKTFRYKVQAYKTNSWHTDFAGPSGDLTTPTLVAPTAFSATRVAEAEVDLQWTDNSNDEDGFYLERCLGSSCADFAEVSTVSAMPNTVLSLKMDEAFWVGSADEVTDYSGNNNHATVLGGATTTSDSHSGRSANLDGSEDYLTTTVTVDQSVSSVGVTMMAWVKPTSTTAGDHYLFSTENGTIGTPNNNWGLLRNGGTWYVATGEASRTTAVAVTSGAWQHVAVVFSQTGVKFYKNGAETSVDYIGNHVTSAAVTIGRQGILDQSFFDGLVDDAKVFDRALSLDEINDHYADIKWFTDTTVAANQIYTYRVRATKATDCGTTFSTAPTDVEVETIPPPPLLTATLADSATVVLTWTPQTSTQTSFKIERCNGSASSPADIIDGAVAPELTTFIDTTVCFGTDGINRYQITALGAWGESDPSAVATTTIVGADVSLALSVSRVTEAQVEISMDALDSDRDGFSVLRCAGLGCTPTVAVDWSPTNYGDDNLLALWQMNEINRDSTSVIDSSGNANHGTAVNGTGTTTDGKFGYGAALFDGTNDYISTTLAIDETTDTNGATFEAWIYPTNQVSAYRCIMSTSNSHNDYDWGLCFHNVSWYIDTGSTRSYGGASITFNEWQHIVIVFDPVAGISLYRNNVNVKNIAAIGFDTSSTFTIGKEGGYNGYYFSGMMDNVAVYDRPLSAAEVTALYNSGNIPQRTFAFTDTYSIDAGTDYEYLFAPHKGNTCSDLDGEAVSEPLSASTLDPATLAPTDFTCTANNTTEVSCTWTPNTSSQTNYRLERCSGLSCSSFSLVNDAIAAGSVSYTDSSACEGEANYTYRIRAEKNTATTWETGWATDSLPTPAANAPVITSITAMSESQIDLAWTDTNDDEESFVISNCAYDFGGGVLCDVAEDFTEVTTFPGSVDGAIFHYRMDEEAWVNGVYDILDATGNNNKARSYNGAQTVANGKYARGGDFDGYDDFVDTTINIDQSSTSPGATFEAWVRPTISDGTRRYVISTDHYSYDWGIFHYNNIWYVSSGENYRSTGLAVTVDDWQYVAAVFEPGVGIRFYKNETEVIVPYIDYSTGDYSIDIGKRCEYGTGYNFQGQIDEVLVYNLQLTLAQITSHYNYQAAVYSYSSGSLDHSTNYYYRVAAEKSATCSWSKYSDDNVTTPAPPPPENLLIDCDSTTCSLTWDDMNGSETGYKVSRCDGASSGCGSPTVFDVDPGPGTGSMNYVDNTVCPGPAQQYTYEVWAVGAWGTTSAAEETVSTDSVVDAPTGITATLTTEVEMDVSWTFSTADEEGLTLERCIGAACLEIDLAAGSTSYIDNELAPDTNYCYRVKAYKTAVCPGDWPTAWDGPACELTTVPQNTLIATEVDTSSVEITWPDEYQTETSTVIERCSGNLATCCSANPGPCDGTFATVGAALPNTTSYTDDSACAGLPYTYRASTVGEGLKLGGGGCWTMRAPITFTSFPADSGVEVVVAIQPEMNADFSDIRFFDATGNRELQYWIRESDAGSATVWLMTGANDDIYLYYGNSSATDASASDALFTETYDNFAGTVIDPDKWEVINPVNKVSQNDGLIFEYINNYNIDTAIISTATFERAAGNELYVNFTTNTDTTYKREYFHMGWELDQTASVAYTNLAHGPYFYSFTSHYIASVYDNGTKSISPKFLYNDLTDYELKIVLKDAGAQYYLRGGIYTDWTLFKETTIAFAGDDVLRIGFHQGNHNLTVHTVTVKHVSAQTGAAVNFGAAEGDGIACLVLPNTWTGVYTTADDALTDTNDPPTGLTASAVDGTVLLNWVPGTTDQTGFLIERDCGGGYSSIGNAGANDTSFSDPDGGAITSANCNYQVKAEKTGACGWPTVASTPASVLGPPAAPANIAAAAVNSFKIEISWDDGSDETGYEVERQVFNGAWELAGIAAAGVGGRITFTDSICIDPNTSYNYRVRSYRGAIKSAYSLVTEASDTYLAGDGTCQ